MRYLPLLLLCAALLRAAEAELPPALTHDSRAIPLSLHEDYKAELPLTQSPDTDGQEKVKPDIFYLPTPQRLVDLMLLMAEVKKDDLLYDLGSGDGRLVITAAKTYGARGIGIEIDPELIAIAKRNAARAKVQDKVEFRQQDLFRSDFKDANVITLYLLDELNRRLRPQLFAQVKPGTRIVSHAFHMGEWQPDAEKTLTIKGKKYDAYSWVVPANFSGRWKVAPEAKVKGLPPTVVIEQAFQEFVVRAEEGGAALGEGKVSGLEFYLTMDKATGVKPLSFTGTIDGNSLKATAAGKGTGWKAEREPGTEKPLDPAAK